MAAPPAWLMKIVPPAAAQHGGAELALTAMQAVLVVEVPVLHCGLSHLLKDGVVLWDEVGVGVEPQQGQQRSAAKRAAARPIDRTASHILVVQLEERSEEDLEG